MKKECLQAVESAMKEEERVKEATAASLKGGGGCLGSRENRVVS